MSGSSLPATAPRTATALVTVASVLSQLEEGAIFTGLMEDGTAMRVVAIGREFSPVPGEVWRVEGQWRDHPEFGWQLHADGRSCHRALPTEDLCVRWLCQFDGVGLERAKRLTARFGDDLDGALGPGGVAIEDLAQAIDPDRPNLSASIAAAIRLRWNDVRAEFETVCWLAERGVEDAGVARRVVQLLGADVQEILEDNPYCLAAVLPWRQADHLGQKLLNGRSGCADIRRAPPRILGACDAVTAWYLSKGHTAFLPVEFVARVARKLRLRWTAELAEQIRKLALENRAVLATGNLWRAPGCAFMEEEIRKRLARMHGGMERSAVAVPGSAGLDQIIRNLENRGRPLHPEQRAAVRQVLEAPLSVLTGGAGTGKTATARAVVDAWEALGGRVEMAALSGMAALRLSQGTCRTGREHRPALTIFRLLKGLRRREQGRRFWTDAVERQGGASGALLPKDSLPVLDDCTLLIIDEASMVGLGEMHAVLSQLPTGCRLLLIGDPFQLPPVGFGIVFHHLVEQASLVARLDTIHRQTFASGIPVVSRAVREGSPPAFRPFTGAGSGVCFVDCADDDLTATVVRIVDELGGFRTGSNELRIIAALTERGHGAVHALNTAFHRRNLSAQVHPDRTDEPKAVKGWLGQWFAAGDPVVHKTNSYDRGLFNGSLGRVAEINPEAGSLVASFDGHDHRFSRKQLLDLALGYAVTCHRAQGSQARRVIVPVVDTPLVDPTWIYTGITRAEEQAILVGRRAVLEQALAREPSFKRRVTGQVFDLGSSSTVAH